MLLDPVQCQHLLNALRAGGTRTSILTPGVDLTPQELQPHTMDAILEDASLVYFDGRLTDCAVLLAKAARQKGVPVLVEAERPREGLDELLQQADYLCTSTHFPKVHQCHQLDYDGTDCTSCLYLFMRLEASQSTYQHHFKLPLVTLSCSAVALCQ